MAIAAAVLIGTIVGAGAFSVVMAVVQPPKHDAGAEAERAGAAPSPGITPPQAVQASSNPPPQEVASSANDPNSPSNQESTTQSQNGQANQQAAGQAPAAPSHEASVAERAPWPTPRSAVKKRAEFDSAGPATSVQPAMPAQPPAPKSAAATGAASPDSAATNKSRGEPRRSRFVQQQPRSPDDAAQSGDDRGTVAYPRRRVIVLPGPQRDADYGNHGGGPFRLFDFAGHDRWNDDRWRSDDRWGNDRWNGSGRD